MGGHVVYVYVYTLVVVVVVSSGREVLMRIRDRTYHRLRSVGLFGVVTKGLQVCRMPLSSVTVHVARTPSDDLVTGRTLHQPGLKERVPERSHGVPSSLVNLTISQETAAVVLLADLAEDPAPGTGLTASEPVAQVSKPPHLLPELVRREGVPCPPQALDFFRLSSSSSFIRYPHP